MSELHDINRRVAVLEQIARDTATALQDIRAELRQLRSDMNTEIRELRRELRWLLRLMIGGFVGTWALLGHGSHWF